MKTTFPWGRRGKRRGELGGGVVSQEWEGVIFVSTPTMLHLCLSHTPKDHPLRERVGQSGIPITSLGGQQGLALKQSVRDK